jgi:hypothetical protein
MAANFPKLAEQQIKAKLQKLKIGYSGELERTMKVLGTFQAQSLSVKIEILYAWYGIFTDRGVGRGIKSDETTVAKLYGFKRKPKNWTREIARQKHRVGEVYTSIVADSMLQDVAKVVFKSATFKL